MKEVRLGEIFQISSGGTPKRDVPEYYDSGNVPWVKTGELKGKYISKTHEYITELALLKSSAKLFPEKTVLLAMYGSDNWSLLYIGLCRCNQPSLCRISTE
jgi:type I restriction enzyme, S subunit